MKRKRKARKGNRVVMAMSGGVDSSVAAALLKRAGFDVVGVFMKFWSEAGGKGKWNRCCSPDSEKRARETARILKIPFYVFNFEKEFKKRIVDYFLKEYKSGTTPNPCVVCNKEIKFGILLEKAVKLNADYVATGHYARIQQKKDGVHLLKAKDKDKDQIYFLWQLNQKQLKRILFPVGGYTKSRVRALARKFKLPVEGISESMEVCFISTTLKDFLKRHLKMKPGRIVDQKGKELGRHQGLWFYTIGQRKGIEISNGPYYVLDKDLKNNVLIVSKYEKEFYRKELKAKNVNWILGSAPKAPLKIKARIRYGHKAVPAVITEIAGAKASVKFLKPQRSVTPGQSVVFYRGEELVAGGVIC